MSDANAVPASEGHPPGLYMMFFAELWERFCYYGMRALLALYVVQQFHKPQEEASLSYGAFTALVYATGIFGGYVAGIFSALAGESAPEGEGAPLSGYTGAYTPILYMSVGAGILPVDPEQADQQTDARREVTRR